MKRRLKGQIVSDKMQNTAVVAVSHLRRHPKYLKYYRVTSRFKVHNENNEYKSGDYVIIEETRPMSKTKRFKIVGLTRRGEAERARHEGTETNGDNQE